jgi:hypothetical protein
MLSMRTSVIALLIGASLGQAACGSDSTANSTEPATKNDAGATSGGSGGSGNAGSGGSPTSAPATGGSGGATSPDGSAPPVADASPAGDLSTAPTDALSGAPAAPEKFAGDWKYDSGTARLDCPGQAPLMEDLKDATLTFDIGAGVAPLILSSAGCTLYFDIKGSSAVIKPGQTCKNPIAGKPATSAPTVFTFSLTGTHAVQQASWTVTFADAPTKPCTLSNDGKLTLTMP